MKFYHSPAIGDVIYGLHLMQSMGGGSLYLDPLWNHHEKFSALRSFVERQEYVQNSFLYGCPHVIEDEFFINMDSFRDIDNPKKTDLIRAHYIGMNKKAPQEIEPWLVARRSDVTYPVVVHRSPRYRDNAADYGFLRHIDPKLLFCIGYDYEVEEIQKVANATWIQTPTVDAMASVIDSCKVFIGNQSSPYAIATGLGKLRMLERDKDGWDNVWLGQKTERQVGIDARLNLRKFFELYSLADG